MVKTGIYILLICVIGSFGILWSEYTHYSDVHNQFITLQNEVNETYNRLSLISDDIVGLKLEEETINNEKKIQIEQYKKWLRQNQILKDLTQ